MAEYQTFPSGLVLSEVLTAVQQRFDATRSLERGTVEPPVKLAGLQHHATSGSTVLTTVNAGGLGLPEAIARWNGTTWVLAADPRHAAINRGGTVPFIADQPMNNKAFTGLRAGAAAGESVRYEQAVLVSGVNAMAADLDLGGFKAINAGAPEDPGDLVRLADLDGLTAEFPASLYHQTSEDIRDNGWPVRYRLASDMAGTFTRMPYPPRVFWLRMGRGRAIRQSDGQQFFSLAGDVTYGPFPRWDPVGDDPGVFDTLTVASFTSTPPVGPPQNLGNIRVIWKYPESSPTGQVGLFIEIRDGSGNLCRWRTLSDSNVDAAMQVIGMFGVGA